MPVTVGIHKTNVRSPQNSPWYPSLHTHLEPLHDPPFKQAAWHVLPSLPSERNVFTTHIMIYYSTTHMRTTIFEEVGSGWFISAYN
jgi:hypothetical protein